VSHQQVNKALQIEMSNPTEDVRRYTAEVTAWLRGDGPATHLQQHAAPVTVPVYVAAITSRTVEHAAEIADGIMPIFWSPERVRESKAWMDLGRARVSAKGPVCCGRYVPCFLW